MRKVYKFNGEGFDVAWIGKTAPVPEGWYLDANSAREAIDPVKPAPEAEVTTETAAPRRLGRPPKKV
jgi:hypothetical protein